MEPIETVRSKILNCVTRLEQRCGRITACRVVVKGSSGRHQTGGIYDVSMWLSLPEGREVAVEHTPQNDERYADLAFAINDAFKRARRQLQDKVRLMQRQTKTHEVAPIGIVKRIEGAKGYGFLETSDGREIYFHENSVLNGQFAKLKAGTRVTFTEKTGEKGPQASTVKRLGRHTLRV
ncbi:MAG: cold shock domain-containing protein [Phyllobacterium sp.]|uniref:cold shock domain-containing protein n=1 Tax=Phyllobacterium sp. TaxID=1871046 RepID=UPI0030EFE00C